MDAPAGCAHAACRSSCTSALSLAPNSAWCLESRRRSLDWLCLAMYLSALCSTEVLDFLRFFLRRDGASSVDNASDVLLMS